MCEIHSVNTRFKSWSAYWLSWLKCFAVFFSFFKPWINRLWQTTKINQFGLQRCSDIIKRMTPHSYYFTIYIYSPQNVTRVKKWKEDEMDRACGMYDRDKTYIYICIHACKEETTWNNRSRWEEKINIELKETKHEAWSGFMQLKKWTSKEGVLWTRYEPSNSKKARNSWVAERKLTSQD